MADITTGTKLYNLLTTRDFENFKVLDSKTSKPPVNDQGQEDISKANMFVFDWTSEQRHNYGTVVVLLGADKNLSVFFGDNLGKSMEGGDKKEWFDFLYQLKQFATKNFLGFSSDNLNRLRYSLQGQAQVNEGLFESWVGTRTVSYSGRPTEARLMIKHNRTLGEGDARFRYVESLYIETAEGERFKLPFTKLNGGRAMVEHVRQGGKPYDLRGQHITSMVEEINVLSRFRRANHGKIFEGDTEQLVLETNTYYENISRVLKGLSSSRGYGQYFESWNPNEVTDQELVIEDIKNLFVTQNIDSRIEAALPVLARIQQQGTAMKEANIFEQWIDKLEEGTWALPETPEQKEKLAMLLSNELIVGADATNATEQLYDLIGDDKLFDLLNNLADKDANANAWADPAVVHRLRELAELDSNLAEVLDNIDISASRDEQEPAPDETEVDEGLLDAIASKLGHGSDEDMLADLQKKAGLPVTGKKPGEELNAPAHDEHEVDEQGVAENIGGVGAFAALQHAKNLNKQPQPTAPTKKQSYTPRHDDHEETMGSDDNYDDEMAEEINSLRRAAGLKENVTLDENGQTLQHILNTFKRDIKDFKATGSLSDHLYDALFDYYAPDMPYGVAKARTGDPDQWIADRFGADIGMLNFGSNSPSTDDYEEETDEGVLGTLGGGAVGAMLGGPVGGIIGAGIGQAATDGGSGIIEQDDEETDEGWKGQLAGGTVGAIGGELAGAALGGPLGALAGGALGGTAGQMVGDNLGGEEELDEARCNMTGVGDRCPIHGLNECWAPTGVMEESADKFDLGRLKTLANIR